MERTGYLSKYYKENFDREKAYSDEYYRKNAEKIKVWGEEYRLEPKNTEKLKNCLNPTC
jgi:hypothetical protein